jgi:hypothetical protein
MVGPLERVLVNMTSSAAIGQSFLRGPTEPASLSLSLSSLKTDTDPVSETLSF